MVPAEAPGPLVRCLHRVFGVRWRADPAADRSAGAAGDGVPGGGLRAEGDHGDDALQRGDSGVHLAGLRADRGGVHGPAGWKVANGYMEVNKTGTIQTRDSFGDCQFHIEFATPVVVKGSSQGRGNSGVYFMGRYEVQILDSYENRSYADGQAGALYGQYPPLVNASRKPGEWQAFDIIFEAPRFENDKLIKPAFVTVLHNGIVIHHRTQLAGATAHKRPASYRPHASEGPLKLQDHGNPTRFRNAWIRPLKGYDEH